MTASALRMENTEKKFVSKFQSSRRILYPAPSQVNVEISFSKKAYFCYFVPMSDFWFGKIYTISLVS